MGHVHVLARKSDVACCKWACVNDAAEHANNDDKQCNWMKWDVTAANWIACKLPDCTLEGFVYGSLME